jgi:hypothetical protein
VIYFSGHGYLNDGSEHWLLSEAPTNPNEAVNVEENIQLARDCGIPNVVFISDACRSTPQSVKADRVRGMLIFPSTGVSVRARADVDRFFACLPGDPAYEVAVDKSSGVYSALFTSCLEEAYQDTPKEQTTSVGGVEVLTNRKLKRILPGLVEARAIKFSTTLFQKPDAIVESEPEIYLGRVRRSKAVAETTGLGAILEQFQQNVPGLGSIVADMFRGESVRREGRPQPQTETVPDVSTLRSHGDGLLAEALGAAAHPGSPAAPTPELKAAIATASQLAAVDHFETQCGLGVRGADVVEALGLGCVAEIVNVGATGEDRLVRVMTGPQGQPTPFARTVLLRFDGGDCAAIPAIEGYVASIVVDRRGGGDGPTDGIVQVAYTPSNNNYRFSDFDARRSQVESLRALVAALARNGVLRLDKGLAPAFAESIRRLKALDPTLGIYASYAYNDTGLIDKIRSVESFMRSDLAGATIYDVALLLRAAKASVYPTLFPFCPMLSQGWALLRVLGGDLPAAIRDAAQHRRASLWTTFKPAGADIIFKAANDGELK